MSKKKRKPKVFKIHVPAERLGDPHLWVEGVCPSTGVVKEIEALSEREANLIARGWQREAAKIEADTRAHDRARRETKEF